VDAVDLDLAPIELAHEPVEESGHLRSIPPRAGRTDPLDLS